MAEMNRRSFVKSSFLATAGMGLSAHSWNQVLGANDAVRIAVVGFNGQGQSHIQGFQKIPGVRVVALCDADRDVLEKQVSDLRKGGVSVTPYTDVRKLLESKEVDAITTATPNHWHALITVWACQAGKDVYVEKPVSHEVWEGRRMVEAARKYHRIVQTGTQTRSSVAFRDALSWVAAGSLGKIRIARGLCYKRRKSIGKVDGPRPVPASVDYDLWCGPAPKGPLMRERLHYDWHWVWPTGNGDLGNQGIHQMDVARWALGKKTVSPRVFSVGGRLGYVDDGETPNTQFIVHDYGDSLLIFEVRGLPAKAGDETMDKYRGESVGNVVECESGYLADTTAYDHEGNVIKQFAGNGDDEAHHGNFIKAVRSRKVSDLNADILEGHLSSALCHTGNISYRVGERSRPEEIKEAIKGDKQSLETYERFREHLGANGIDLEKTPATLGALLKMDVATETFVDNPSANALLRREYRQPFVLPEKV